MLAGAIGQFMERKRVREWVQRKRLDWEGPERCGPAAQFRAGCTVPHRRLPATCDVAHFMRIFLRRLKALRCSSFRNDLSS